MSTLNLTTVILENDDDYLPWIEIIHTAADKHSLQDYIDPTRTASQLKRLEPPTKPTPASVKAQPLAATPAENNTENTKTT